MTTKPDPAHPIVLTDPHHEGIRNVDVVTFHRTGTSHLDITCCALLPRSSNGIDWANEAQITARLRMDVTMAKAFAEGLLKQVAMIEGSESTMN